MARSISGRWVRAAAALAAFVVLGTAWVSRARADEGGGRERDPLYKFSFNKPDAWTPVPIAPTEAAKYMVRRWSQKDASAKGEFWPETMVVYRSEAVHKKDQDDEDKPVADLVEFLKKEISDASNDHVAFLAPKEIKSKDDIPGRMWVTESKVGSFRKNLHVFAVWTQPEVQVGMWLSCGDEQRRRDSDLFVRIVQSFQWYDAKAKEATAQTALKDLGLPPEKREALEKGLVKGWALLVSPKKQYVVVYNTKGKRNDRLAQMVVERIEQIRADLYETQFPAKKQIDEVSIIRICGDRDEYLAYGGPYGSAGYWSWQDGELVLYDASPGQRLDEDTLSVAFHEAFHQYIYYGVGQVDPPSWFNEGHGDYYAGARSAAGKFTVRPFSWRVGIIKAACHAGPCKKGPDGQYDRKKGGYTPLADFLHFSQQQYYDPSCVDVCYAQGWSFIYFLREIVPKNPEWKAKWGGILDTYFLTLRGKQEERGAKKAAAPKDDPTTSTPTKKKVPGTLGDPGPVPPDDEDEPAAGAAPALPPPSTAKTDGSGGVNDIPRIAPPPKYDATEDNSGDTEAAFYAAFLGVDLKELEAAWRQAVGQIPG